jgi:hypothetical protein
MSGKHAVSELTESINGTDLSRPAELEAVKAAVSRQVVNFAPAPVAGRSIEPDAITVEILKSKMFASYSAVTRQRWSKGRNERQMSPLRLPLPGRLEGLGE